MMTWHDDVAGLQAEHKSLSTHVALAERIQRVTKEASAVKIHLVVFSLCWALRLEDAAAGAALDVPADVRAFARGLVDMCGASLVHGHGPSHALGCEVWPGAPILYSLGAVVSAACAGESTIEPMEDKAPFGLIPVPARTPVTPPQNTLPRTPESALS